MVKTNNVIKDFAKGSQFISKQTEFEILSIFYAYTALPIKGSKETEKIMKQTISFLRC